MQQKTLLIAGALIGTLLVVIGFFLLRPELQEQILPQIQHPAQQETSQESPDISQSINEDQKTDVNVESDVTRIVIHHKSDKNSKDIDDMLSEKVIINDKVVDSPKSEH